MFSLDDVIKLQEWNICDKSKSHIILHQRKQLLGDRDPNLKSKEHNLCS